MTNNELKIGKEYLIKHDRKGKFSGILRHYNDAWLVFVITRDDLDSCEEVTVRRSFCEILDYK